MRAILSHPYSNALFWWFDNLQGGEGTLRQSSGHPYYEHLYRDADTNIDVALTAAVVFDDLVIPGIDAYFPNTQHAENFNEELGMLVDWDRQRRAREFIERNERRLQSDSTLSGWLADGERQLDLEYAVADILLSSEEDARVICSVGRQQLICDLLSVEEFREELDRDEVAFANGKMGSVSGDLASYVSVAGVRLQMDNWEDLGSLKRDSRIRTYASGFIADADSNTADRPSLLDRLSDAADAADGQKNFAGFFTATSRTLDATSFIPAVGTLSSIGSLVSSAVAGRADRKAEAMKWHELGAEMMRVQSLNRIEAAMRDRSSNRDRLVD